jgi:ParB/RepB/Spo0J family partition protein
MGKKVVTENLYSGEDYLDQMTRQAEHREPTVRKLPLDKIKIKENVRIQYTKVEEMANSIKEKGLLQPITVTETDGGFYEIVFGHRRYKGYCFLNEREPGKYTKIEAIVKDKNDFDEDEIVIFQLIENLIRENLSPSETVNAFKELRKKGYTNKMIADKLGKGEGFVKNTFSSIKTIDRNPELNELLESNVNVTLTDIQEVKPLPFKFQIKLLEQKARGEIKTMKELRSHVWKLRGELSNKDHSRYEQKKDFDILTRKPNSIKVRSFTFDFSRNTDDDKQTLVKHLKSIIQELEKTAVSSSAMEAVQ